MPEIPRPERGPKLEIEILAEVRHWLASQPDVSVHRNNTGKLPNRNGRLVTYGLSEGSSDLIGSVNVMVRPIRVMSDGETMPATCTARAMAIEVKTDRGTLTEEQTRFLSDKRKIGWIVGVVRSVDDAKVLIEKARRWEI